MIELEQFLWELELFEKAKRYLATPVCRSGYIDRLQVTDNMVLAGESALSEKTMQMIFLLCYHLKIRKMRELKKQ
mgnify:FL=1